MTRSCQMECFQLLSTQEHPVGSLPWKDPLLKHPVVSLFHLHSVTPSQMEGFNLETSARHMDEWQIARFCYW